MSKDRKGPFADQVTNWRACTVHPWVLATIDRGYRLQFVVKPPVFNGVVMSAALGESAHVLEEEISSLLIKGVIRIIPMEEGEGVDGRSTMAFIIILIVIFLE